jgi:hypothetical protein
VECCGRRNSLRSDQSLVRAMMKQRDIPPASPRRSNLLDAEGFPFDAAAAVDLQPMSQCCDFSSATSSRRSGTLGTFPTIFS